MNLEEKARIKELRQIGLGYKKISKELGISINTIKSFCRNNKLTSKFLPKIHYCKECKKEIKQKENTKKRIFCSNECKRKWWNKNRALLNKTTLKKHICLNCHKHFKSYINEHRKYCSHVCYVEYRFKAGKRDE